MARLTELQDFIYKNFYCGAQLDQLSDCVYHYTSPKAAISILQGENSSGKTKNLDFAFTHYKYLNDRREFEDGLSIARSWLKRVANRADAGISQASARAMLRMLGKDDLDHCYNPFVLSFARERDSTSQWSIYTDPKKAGMPNGAIFSSTGFTLAHNIL